MIGKHESDWEFRERLVKTENNENNGKPDNYRETGEHVGILAI
jgi:hypothetical protein